LAHDAEHAKLLGLIICGAEPNMPVITLPDGSQRTFEQPLTVLQLAQSIGPGLAKAALAGTVDGKQVDLSHLIGRDAAVSIITEKDEAGVEIIRHSTAHLLAHAVKQLFPTAQVTIGPVIQDGFYYDFAFERPFTTQDLEVIEARMRELAAAGVGVQREEWNRDDAVTFFMSQGEAYKAEIISSIPSNEQISLYRQGDFIDLCRGPHVPSTSRLKAFKLTKVAGAYWRGDSRNEMLQRIYGTAWADEKQLKAYLHRIEEAEKRDHRRIGKQLSLFHIQEEAPGMVFWHDHGWRIYLTLQHYIRNLLRLAGYQEVHTPQVVDRSLWERSGHWEKFREGMFTTASEERDYAIKPMNCPCHVQIFNQGLRSYRELPLRMAEFGSCHRNEPSGSLHGLMRVRGFTQDDAHIFCTEDQIQSEVSAFIDLVYQVYGDLGFQEINVALSTRPAQRVGSDELWDKAEEALALALNTRGLKFKLQPGEGAFYGPKIEFALKDCLERVWQCGTVQVDFAIPGRLGAEYVAEDNTKKTPVMLHRAILGSLERFIGILIEQHAGAMPAWLAPVQVAVLSITDRTADQCAQIAKSLAEHGIFAEPDLRNEKIGFKIREHTLRRVPYMLVVGDKELEQHTVAVRSRAGKDFGSMSLASFVDRLKREIQTHGRETLED
jgi:threonyl-tRNA synthetase